MHWRVGWGWATVALLTVPLLVSAILWPLSAWVDPAFAPGFKLQLFTFGLLAGLCEEIGWTGFATPRWLARRSALAAGLQLGVPWAVWHAAADFSSNHATMGARWWAWFAVFWLATLPAYRMLMTWVYAHTHSLLLAILMHASYTGWLLVLFPSTAFEQGLVWQALFAASLWCVVAVAMLWRSPPASMRGLLRGRGPGDFSEQGRRVRSCGAGGDLRRASRRARPGECRRGPEDA